MELNFHWINLLVLFGAIQGLIFGIALLFNKKHPGAAFLSIFMFALAYNGFETFNWSAGLDRHYVFFDLFSFITIFAVGPSLYLYVTSLLRPQEPVSKRKVILHFGFVFLQFGIRSFIIAHYLLGLNTIIGGPASDALDFLYGLYSELLSVAVFIAYLVATIYEYRKYRAAKPIRSMTAESQRVVKTWIQALLACMTALGLAWPLTVLFPYLFDIGPGIYYYPIELGLVLFIYWIAITGFHRTKTIFLRTAGPMSEDGIQEQLALLRQSMEKERLYLDPEMNLNKLATHTGIPPKTISAILNQYHGVNFSDFLNGYRVREVCDRLRDPAYEHLTIAGIAFESGFNSQATFQRAFKNSTGMSPRNFVARELKKSA